MQCIFGVVAPGLLQLRNVCAIDLLQRAVVCVARAPAIGSPFVISLDTGGKRADAKRQCQSQSSLNSHRVFINHTREQNR